MEGAVIDTVRSATGYILLEVTAEELISRREPMTDGQSEPESVLYTGVAAALSIAGQGVLQDTSDSLQIVGKKVAALVEPGERVAFYSPAWVKIDGKSRPGALAFTEARLIVGFAEGATRLTTSYARAVPLRSIVSSRPSRSKISLVAPRERMISIEAPGLSFDAVFNADGNKRALFTTSIFLIRGVAKVVFDDEDRPKTLALDQQHPGWRRLKPEMDAL